MKKYFRVATFAYLSLLGIMVGAGLFAGVAVAPVIFNSEVALGASLLTHFQEGLLMTKNFIKLSYLVDLTLVAIFLYEGYKYKMGERDNLTLVAVFFALSSGLLFAHYYMPDILTMQSGGEAMTTTQAFINTHKGSEIDFKLFIASLLLLMVRNMQKACK